MVLRTLVLGGSGQIGSHLKNNYFKFSKEAKAEHNIIYKDSKTLNLLDLPSLKLFFKSNKKFDHLIFLVGLAHFKGVKKDILAFEQINYSTLQNTLSALEETNKTPRKIIFTSSISIYGEKYNQKYYKENSIKRPFSPYAITKLAAENLLISKFSKISWVLRLAPVYSSNFNLNIDRRTKIKNTFYKIGNGKVKLSLCHIDNIIICIIGILKDKLDPGVYNLSDKIEYTYTDLLMYQNAKKIIKIPTFLIFIVYFFSWITNNIFLKENSIKLFSNNIFCSKKIQKNINIKFQLNTKKRNVC
tara:strand:- start:4999 stop:5901 length:903 start_codon:yes stop_codon:yes gene_type:complete